jgi:hypothetical protein
MKIGEWDNLGRARALLQRQLGQLFATEYAAHVAVNDSGRLRIMVATDVGLLDYIYAPVGANLEGQWILRGQAHRWASVRGLRLQTDAQMDDNTEQVQEVWRLVAEDPKIDLSVTSETGDKPIEGLLGFAKACLQNAG